MKSVSFCVSSVTQANKAERALKQAGIAESIRRSDCGMPKNGCAYEVIVPMESAKKATAVLEKANVPLISRKGGA